jgi:DNA-binding PadR family transcriptional regulator
MTRLERSILYVLRNRDVMTGLEIVTATADYPAWWQFWEPFRRVSRGNVYTTLLALDDQGLVRSAPFIDERFPEVIVPRRYYALTPQGVHLVYTRGTF